MSRAVLEKHKQRVLLAIREEAGMRFGKLRGRVGLIADALERCIGSLKREGRLTIRDGRFYCAEQWSAEVEEAERRVARQRAAAKKERKQAEALQRETVGGVEMFRYKLQLLGELEKHFAHTGQPDVANDVAHIARDFERLVNEPDALGEAA